MTSASPSRFTFVYNPKSGRYRNVASGRFVGSDEASEEVQKTIDAAVAEMDSMLNAVLNESIDATIADWQRAMATRLRQLHGAMMLVGVGGVNNVQPSDRRKLAATLQAEFRFLEGFAAAAPTLSEKQIRARMRQYTNKIWNSYWTGKTSAMQRDTGATHEQRFLRPAEHCQDCEDLAAKGKQPIGTLPDPGDGSTQCGSNDKCVKKYYRKEGSKYIQVG